MNKLIAQLQRLYFLPEQQLHGLGATEGNPQNDFASNAFLPKELVLTLDSTETLAVQLVSGERMVRTLLVRFERAVDWALAAKLYEAVQQALELPAPAVSVSGKDGYCLWFSLADPVALELAGQFLQALREAYLHELQPAYLKFCPDSAASPKAFLNLPPALHPTSGKWSAFIDPGMGSMFVDEPGLGMAPNMDRQADLLAGLKSIKTNDFERALLSLKSTCEARAVQSEQAAAQPGEGASPSVSQTPSAPDTLNLGSEFSDPKSFLLAVMNDASASADQRIEAAKALQPYFVKETAQ